jgi:HAE1 family hydrophobic/amphiphilic exporter-1
MLVSTVLNLFFIPVLYVLLKTFLERFSKHKPTALPEPPPQPAL